MLKLAKNLNTLLLFIILLVAFILRFYQLGQIPPALDWDENSNAYNAYSILKTGKDEYGNFLPLTNRSFDDYKPPLYMYLNVVSVKLFGLNPFAARIPSALFGFLTVPLIYLLTKWLFRKSPTDKRNAISLLAAFMLSVSPWHIQFSRVAFESNIALFWATLSITLFLYALENKKLLILSAVSLGITAYSYHTERIFTPLLFIAALIIFKKEVFSFKKTYLLSFIILACVIVLPLVASPKDLLKRFEVASSGPRQEDIDKSIQLQIQDVHAPFSKIIHNRRILIAQDYVANYLTHFDFNFMFTKGDGNFRHHIQDMGMLYLFELPLILVGVYILLKDRSKEAIFILSWLLIAPIAASPANPTPHANRSLPMVIPLEIISAVGLVSIFRFKFKFKKIALCFVSTWILVSIAVYLHNYYAHYPQEKSSFWQYGYIQAAQESNLLKNQYQKVIVDHDLEQAYIFWLFNTKYDPALYQKSGSRYHFDKFYFDGELPTSSSDLFISQSADFPDDFQVVKTIKDQQGIEIIKIGHPKN